MPHLPAGIELKVSHFDFTRAIQGTHNLAGPIYFATFTIGFMLISRILSRIDDEDEFPAVFSISIIPFIAGFIGMLLGNGNDSLLMGALVCGLATAVISVTFLKLRLRNIVIISLLSPILFLVTWYLCVQAQYFIVDLLLTRRIASSLQSRFRVD